MLPDVENLLLEQAGNKFTGKIELATTGKAWWL